MRIYEQNMHNLNMYRHLLYTHTYIARITIALYTIRMVMGGWVCAVALCVQTTYNFQF